MDKTAIRDSVRRHFEAIISIGERPVGSRAAMRAEDYAESTLRAAGFETRRDGYDCPDWSPASIRLRSEGRDIAGALANPFSPPAQASGLAAPVSSLDELAALDMEGSIPVLGPELCPSPIMPKSFSVYNPDEHRCLVSIIEEKRPAALVAVSAFDEGIWPIFADHGLALSSATVPRSALSSMKAGSRLEFKLESRTRPSRASTVSGVSRGREPEAARILLCAHLDTKHYTIGALDNGGGVALLLAAAEVIGDRPHRADVEIVFFMGEERDAAGEFAWLEARGGGVADIGLAINCDGAGGSGGPTALSLFNFADKAKAELFSLAAGIGSFEPAEPWYEGDHYLFWPSGIPTIAASSHDPHRYDRLIHTPRDLPGLVDEALLAELAEFCAELAQA